MRRVKFKPEVELYPGGWREVLIDPEVHRSADARALVAGPEAMLSDDVILLFNSWGHFSRK